MDTPSDITPEELATRLQEDNPPLLLDVRTHDELQRAALPGAMHIPLHLLPMRVGELDRAREIAVFCHLGGRSEYAVALLRSLGFSHARNLSGGIDAWSMTVDPSVPRY